MGDCCEDELPLVLGSGREVHHHNRLAHVRFGIAWGAAQFSDPGLRECIPVRSVQLVPSLVDWHQGTSPLKAGATVVPDAGSPWQSIRPRSPDKLENIELSRRPDTLVAIRPLLPRMARCRLVTGAHCGAAIVERPYEII